MLMADNGWLCGDLSAVDEFGGCHDYDLSIDMGTLLDILEEEKDPDRVQSSSGDLLLRKSSQDEPTQYVSNHNNFQLQSGFQDGLMDHVTSYPSYNLDPSDAGTEGSGDFSSKLEPTERMGSPLRTCSASFNDWFQQASGTCRQERIGISQQETPGCSTASSFSEGHGYRCLDHGDNMDFHILPEGKAGIQFGHEGSQIDSEFVDASHSLTMENLDEKYGRCGDFIGNRFGSLGLESNLYTLIDVPYTDADVSSYNVTSTDSTICHSSEIISDVDDLYSAKQCYINTGNPILNDPSSFKFQHFFGNVATTTNTKDQVGEFPIENACSSRVVLNAQGDTGDGSVMEVPLPDYFDVMVQDFKCEDIKHVSPTCGNSLSNIDIRTVDGKRSVQPFSNSHSHFSNKKQSVSVKDEGNDELSVSRSMITGSVELVNEVVSGNSSYHDGGNSFPYEDSRQSFTGLSPSLSKQKHVVHAEEEKEDMILEYKKAWHCQETINGSFATSPIDGRHLSLNINDSRQYFPSSQPSTLNKKQLKFFKEEREAETKPASMGPHMSKLSPESIQSNSSDCKSHVDDDPDICILEDISQPARSNQSVAFGKTFSMSQTARSNLPVSFVKPIVTSQHSSYSDSANYPGLPHNGLGGMRLKAIDERLIFQVALQDLSQPKSEASPPDGVLTVPLLRHQRIALSWMVQKETSSMHCSGGILADDQGLGKTISMIALILKERPPSFRTEDVSKCELETLNLDDDDDDNEANGLDRMTDCHVTSNGGSAKRFKAGHAKGRPAAGTLVVCPTSVLRQWAEELRNKVSSKGSLSILVYHGSNRTKDPCEVAKYDVVITTYSIVSMEVPKQPLVDKEDDEDNKKAEGDDVPSIYCSSGKKRKYAPGSDKKGLKPRKGADGMLFDMDSGPLAKVGWFRVVLDEAQSIKNHRTQVARACWGLRAKRRWCLSGTPIQNAIDDLYSYFRFLRYDPFAVYKSFCSRIKVPISKNPVKGYKKLQAVLKTVMLRRTKGTLLDGEPIINLPPKVIKLKQVDFTDEERDFYNQLEVDSRDQFKEYAAAGTVKQNYVNILLMLLRLRQACDHPLLVKGFDSNSILRSSVEMAKKLPQEKQMYLLKCLEASLAICGICNDPPEDAVVSVCGHVFCNQCICEHLTGDDNHCPTTNCKVRLTVSSVFSKATLNKSLSQQPGEDDSIDCSDSKSIEAVEPLRYNSSKIKAVLEVLQSLAKPRGHALTGSSLQSSSNESPSHPGDSYDLNAGDSLKNIPDGKKLIVQNCLNDSIKVGGEKAIVFSQWTKMLDLFEACLKDSSIQYRRLDGTMSVVARDKAVKDFNTLPEVSVMIMSLKAASLGLNMVAACHVLLLDLWWNPTTEDQAIDRAHRIGQTRPVTVLRLTVKNTVEDRILALQQKKREMVASAFGEDEAGGRQTRLTVDDLNYLFMV